MILPSFSRGPSQTKPKTFQLPSRNTWEGFWGIPNSPTFILRFNNLLAAASGDASGNAILAIDMEFPGFLRQEPRSGARAQRYQALRWMLRFGKGKSYIISLGLVIVSSKLRHINDFHDFHDFQ